jgi:branched-chain amino acid transport system substrate-binding protein
MLRQMKQLGLQVKYMGGDGICTADLPTLAGDGMADGQVICAEAGGVEGQQAKAMDDFKARFKTKFGMEVQIYAPYVYDATMAMVAAMQKADSTDPKKYLPELAKVRYEGVTGTIAFDPKGDILNGALTLYTYKGGKREMMRVVRGS